MITYIATNKADSKDGQSATLYLTPCMASTARSECLRYFIVESNALQRNSLPKNRQKSGIDCNVTAFVSGLRCTLSKTAFQRNPLQKFKIPTFGTVMIGGLTWSGARGWASS